MTVKVVDVPEKRRYETLLDEARAAGLRVLATCPLCAGWIARHPEYADLLYQPGAWLATDVIGP